MNIITLVLYVAGAFALVLGVLHLSFPERFGIRAAMLGEGPPVSPFRLWFYRYDFGRRELFGVVCIMNYCVSFTIFSIGIADVLASRWLGTIGGALLAGWVAGFWFIRAGTQLFLGKRRGDWFIILWFALLAIVHCLAALQSYAGLRGPVD